MKQILLYIWQLPQNILGLILWLIVGKDRIRAGVYHWKLKGSISLGCLIFLDENATNYVLRHEQGHQVQSRYLGPLYLLVIGLPSIIWAGIVYPIVKGDYYRFYTEKWANQLGGNG